MEEGKLAERRGKFFPYDMYYGALWGYNNNYGLTVRIAYGGPDPTKKSEDPSDGITEINLVGLSIKPAHLRRLADNMIPYLYDKLTPEDREAFLKKLAEPRNEPDMEGIDLMAKYDPESGLFERVSAHELVKFLRDLRDMPRRSSVGNPKKKLEGCVYADMRQLYTFEPSPKRKRSY